MSIKIIYESILEEKSVSILARAKGYSPTIIESQEQEDGTLKQVEIPNPMNEADFVSRVFKEMIVNDATNTLLAETRNAMAEQIRIQEEAIRESVQSSITSTIE